MIKYIGSKRTLVPKIVAIVKQIPDVKRVCDLFTGTTRVAQGFKESGYLVTANDIATYSEVLATTYIEADKDSQDLDKIEKWIEELNRIEGYRGYFTKTFCEDSRFFHPDNGKRIDAIRDRIDQLPTTRFERAILLTSLMLAADKVDSTTGLQMAYLKSWAPRALKPLRMILPELIPGSGLAVRKDAKQFVNDGGTDNQDLTYIDPPYNQHSYFGNYHIWETLVRHDQPEAYGVARKRVDTRKNKSPYNSKRTFPEEFSTLIRNIQSKYLLVSFNNEGYIRSEEMVELLGEKGEVLQIDVDFKRYVGAQIGIHNPAGEKVGKVSHLRNVEHLFLVGPHEITERVRHEIVSPTQATLAF